MIHCVSIPTEYRKIRTRKNVFGHFSNSDCRGCILEVDLEYCKELYELHNDYPLVPEKLKTKREMLPAYQIKIADDYNICIVNIKNLVPNFFDKERYVLH